MILDKPKTHIQANNSRTDELNGILDEQLKRLSATGQVIAPKITQFDHIENKLRKLQRKLQKVQSTEQRRHFKKEPIEKLEVTPTMVPRQSASALGSQSGQRFNVKVKSTSIAKNRRLSRKSKVSSKKELPIDHSIRYSSKVESTKKNIRYSASNVDLLRRRSSLNSNQEIQHLKKEVQVFSKQNSVLKSKVDRLKQFEQKYDKMRELFQKGDKLRKSTRRRK